jgi:hypothetical protein
MIRTIFGLPSSLLFISMLLALDTELHREEIANTEKYAVILFFYSVHSV